MGGSSIWLLPPAGSEIESKLQRLIATTLPCVFPKAQLPLFPPHITLTDDVDPALDPPTVTSSIEVSAPPAIKFEKLNIGKTFFTRITLHLEKTEEIRALAIQCRMKYVTNGNAEEAKKWAESFTPHLSLVYMEGVPGQEEVKKVEEEVAKAGIKFGVEAWTGGSLTLVNCMKPIDQWKPEGVRPI
ncbi:2, 3 cyclic phosphodiesterase [Terfezia boudieri ATCC MYA-4762]|uniref:2, 3 cyclic phosphodiesterase n=1 Tax=Terfezia boudieri ATCC MYA-4762 TaxID=1051890 RepID=A0A3N4M4M4_9PEZI|nr:2, 3 cyclic phosphodiesterase [Terfezia boudieri ATCC MYA-4762]